MKSNLVNISGLMLLGVFITLAAGDKMKDSHSNSQRKSGSPAADGDKKNNTAVPSPSVKSNATCTNVNGTEINCKPSGPTGDGSVTEMFIKNRGMLMRTLYVLIGVTAVVVLYFVVRAVRLRRRKSRTKKYGVLTTPASDLEMTPLDQDDDDEDMTVFEVNGHPR